VRGGDRDGSAGGEGEQPRGINRAGLALTIIAVLGVAYALLARYALDRFPYSGDEYSLALQGELFARGELRSPAPPHAEWLRVDHVVIDRWVRSKYPPGSPALLAIGERYGAAWLVGPLEAVITLLVVWLTFRRVLGPRRALVGLVALGIAPMFMFEAASFYSHTAANLWLSFAFAAIAAWTGRPRDRHLVLAGLAIGCAFLTRPIDAVLFGVAMLALRSPRAVVITAVSALPLVAVSFWYQGAVFDSIFTDGYHAYEPTFRALYGADTAANPMSFAHLFSAEQQYNHLDLFRSFIVEWTATGAAIVALVGGYAIKRGDPVRALRTFAIAVIVVFSIALLWTICDVDDGPRPRYLSIALIPLALLTAVGFHPACRAVASWIGPRLAKLAVVIAVLFSLAQLASFLRDRIPKIWVREGLYQVAAARGLGADAVVIVRAKYPSRYARNGPWFDRVLYLSAPPETTVAEVAAAYPGRAIWEAHEGDPWTLVQVRP